MKGEKEKAAWSCSDAPTSKYTSFRRRTYKLKCSCADTNRSPDPAVQANPVVGGGTCPKFSRVLLHLDLRDSTVVVTKRESFPEKRHATNYIGSVTLLGSKTVSTF